mgnify:CR=1 FL=1|tara:strand:- start:34267 stop:34923 length:657 start_codon:yes stop_codon:yes gene_type:complete
MSNLKELHPKDRLKKLKEMKEKKEQEIAEAQKKIKESEAEITERQKYLDKVPIPELMQEDLAGLSPEGKIAIKEWKGLQEKKEEEEPEEKNEEVSLEEAIEEEIPQNIDPGVQYGPEDAFAPNAQYVQDMIYAPIDELQSQIENVYNFAKEQGYMNQEQQQFILNANAALDEKIESYGSGPATLSEKVSQAATLRQTTGRLLDHQYKTTGAQKDWYKQ